MEDYNVVFILVDNVVFLVEIIIELIIFLKNESKMHMCLKILKKKINYTINMSHHRFCPVIC